MLIPRYWSRLDSEALTPAGKRVPFSVWRGSMSNAAEAHSFARAAAERIAARIRRGEGFPDRYAYGERALREEIQQEFYSSAGELEAVISRNSYGALVLNAAGVLFIDVDLPRGHRAASWLGSLIQRLLKRQPAPEPDPAAEPLERLRQWLTAHPEWGVRVYRTRSGLRYMVTHALFEPAGAESEEAMQFLQSDPQYMRLCRAQKSFRARLTPKPWRCGMGLPPVRFPWADSGEERLASAWVLRYDQASEGYATCSLVEVLGSARIHPSVAPLVALHDQHTRAESGLPLA